VRRVHAAQCLAGPDHTGRAGDVAGSPGPAPKAKEQYAHVIDLSSRNLDLEDHKEFPATQVTSDARLHGCPGPSREVAASVE